MFKWRRRRPKGTRGDRDLEEAARVLEDTEFRSLLDGPGRASGSGADGDGGPDGGNPPDPPVASPDASSSDDSD